MKEQSLLIMLTGSCSRLGILLGALLRTVDINHLHPLGLPLTFPFQCTGQVVGEQGVVFAYGSEATVSSCLRFPHTCLCIRSHSSGQSNSEWFASPELCSHRIGLEIQSPEDLSQSLPSSQLIPVRRHPGDSALVVTSPSLGGARPRGWLLQSSEWPPLFLLLLQEKGSSCLPAAGWAWDWGWKLRQGSASTHPEP